MKAVFVVVAALALAAPALASERHPTLSDLENQLMCPVCAGETLAQSDSLPAQRIKAHVQQRIRQGWTRNQIIDEEVDIWGSRILAAPPRHGFDLLAWVLPIAGLLGGVLVVGALAWRWSRERQPEPATNWSLKARPLGLEEERRLDDELRRFDG
jgi:cytochrome c-type biogenesis protein CcmH